LSTKLLTAATSRDPSHGEGSKNNFRSFIYNYSQNSTNSANFVKIGPVDVEIIGVCQKSLQEAQLSPRDRAMRRVN